VVWYGKLPTYSFVLMNYSCIPLDATESDGRLELNAQMTKRRRGEETRI